MSDDKPIRVLIIDDEEVICHTVATYLNEFGYATVTAPDGEAGLDKARAESFDVVLVDLRMPRIDGLEVVSALKEEQPDLPIVVVSGTGVLKHAIEALRQGAWDYLTKPLHDIDELIVVIERVLERARLIVQRRKAEAQMARHLREALLLNRVIAASSSALKPQAVMEVLCKELAQAFDLPKVVFAQFDTDRKNLIVQAEHRASEWPSVLGQVISAANSTVIRQMLVQQTSLLIGAEQVGARCADVRDWLHQQADMALLLTPALLRGTIVGLFGLLSNEAGVFEPSMIELVQGVATAGTQALENAWLFEQADAARVESQARASALSEANERLKELDRLKSEFLATVSHELRTPLNAIIGFSELLLSEKLGALAPEQRRGVDNVLASGELLLELINNILDFSKIEAGQLDLDEVDFDPGQVVEQMVDLVAPRAFAKGLEFVYTVSPDIPACLRGDPLRLRQVLVNLVSNAVKFTERGQVVVRVDLVHAQDASVRLGCSVADTGIGIPPERLASVFASFVQSDGSVARQYGGSGLGLTISKRLVEMMGGDLRIESQVGRGSTFSFDVVLQHALIQVPAAQPEVDVLANLHLLVVDDNEANRQILCETLNFWGCRCEIAASGIEGLQKLRQAVAGSASFDLVLLDMQMPGVSGLDVLASLRRHPILSQLPVVMVASDDALPPVSDSGERPWAAHLSKPVRRKQLLSTLLEVLRPETASGGVQGRADVEPSSSGNIQDRKMPTLHILLAEDNPVNRHLIKMMLEQLGHCVAAVDNGQTALDLLVEGVFDLIFMDIQMPGMDGTTATQAIRADARWADIPVIAMTAHAMKGDREWFMQAGMDDYVSKPVRVEDLDAVIRRQFARRHLGERL
ncbi:MAG: response regulator [Anaerolineae bacterium]|nr:response regulator [Anaerolineae bacterium]